MDVQSFRETWFVDFLIAHQPKEVMTLLLSLRAIRKVLCYRSLMKRWFWVLTFRQQ